MFSAALGFLSQPPVPEMLQSIAYVSLFFFKHGLVHTSASILELIRT